MVLKHHSFFVATLVHSSPIPVPIPLPASPLKGEENSGARRIEPGSRFFLKEHYP
jgi:hypothetical protein